MRDYELVLYPPPGKGHPFLVVAFTPNGPAIAQVFATAEEAEDFMNRTAPKVRAKLREMDEDANKSGA
ncbi:hypothetical protein [Methylocystis heyeri]|uniref:Uncharacterized protein n=1 Tax=Methylocystis heyeri TaxID=391905 RepID=A0A6B8KE64_9HYPH|nr:hypothetical protein [Methylocystis heyeri]QGM45892.1 hypothetical protein H2LOC_009360 [Methylocystis heyeri]